MMQLYYAPGACSLADHIVLEWVGTPYDVVEMSPQTLKSPAYLALNPRGTVPLLRHGDFLLTENVAILHYLAELHPEAALMGGDSPRERAEVMRWLAFLNSDVHAAFKAVFAFIPPEDTDAPADPRIISARRQTRQHLEWLDR